MALFLNLLTGNLFICLFCLHSFGSYVLKWHYMVKILGDIKIGIYFGLSKITRDAKVGENNA